MRKFTILWAILFSIVSQGSGGSASGGGGGGSGVDTMAAVGSSPNNNGASISSTTLTLQPADGTHPGLVKASGAQTLGVDLTLSGAAPIISALTASTVPYLDASKQLASSAVTPTELGYVHLVTSAIQTQLNAKAPLASPTFTGTVTLPSGSATSSAWDTGTSTLTANGLRLDPTITSDGNSSTAITVDFSHVPVHSVTMTGNATFTLTAPTTGTVCVLKLLEDGTGSRVPTWPAAVKWSGGSAPTLSGANKTDVITLLYDGTNYFGNFILNF